AGAFAGARASGGVHAQLALAAVGGAVTVAAVNDSRAFYPAILTLCFLTGLAYPVRAASIQLLVADALRARAASLASACDKALATVAPVGAGVMARTRRRSAGPMASGTGRNK